MFIVDFHRLDILNPISKYISKTSEKIKDFLKALL